MASRIAETVAKFFLLPIVFLSAIFETLVILNSVDAVDNMDTAKEDSSDVSQETEDKGSSEPEARHGAISGLATSPDGAVCESVGSLSCDRPHSCYRGQRYFTLFDLNVGAEIHDPSEDLVTSAVDEGDRAKNPLGDSEKIPNCLPETKNFSSDIGTTGEARPVIEPQVGPQETPVIAIRVDAVGNRDIAKQDSLGVGQETEDKGSSDLEGRHGAITNLATSPDDALRESVRSLSCDQPPILYRGQGKFTIFDLNVAAEIHDTSEDLVTGAVDEGNGTENPPDPEEIPNCLPETNNASWDIDTTGQARPVVEPHVGPQETPVIPTSGDDVDNVGIPKQEGSDASQETEDKCSSDLEARYGAVTDLATSTDDAVCAL